MHIQGSTNQTDFHRKSFSYGPGQAQRTGVKEQNSAHELFTLFTASCPSPASAFLATGPAAD